KVRVDLATGAAQEVPEFPDNGGFSTATSPSGRRVYLQDYDAFGNKRLLGYALDPATGAPLSKDPTLPLPSGATYMQVLPDGASIAILDLDADALLLVQ